MARKRKVGLTGVNGLGQVEGVNPFWGALASGTLGTGAAMGVRAMTGMDKHAELIGLGVGLAAGAGLMASPRTRAAGFTGVVTALATNGLRFLESMFSAKQQIKDLRGSEASFLASKATTKVPLRTQLDQLKAAASAGGFGVVSAEPRQLAGLGAMSAENRQVLGAVSAENRQVLGAVSAENRQVLGAVSAENRQVLGGGLGIVSPEVIRTLSGNPGAEGHASQPPATIVGGMGGLGSHFGATCIG